MKNKLIDIIDFDKVDVLLEGFNKTTGFVTAILDLEGNVLSKSGWRQICTQFHRINSETSKKCTISDTELANKLAEGEKYHFYKCLNGLVDVAVPIVVEGEHIANLFSGQFFFEKPDMDFFIKQADKYKFNKKTYLSELNKVPIVSVEKVKIAMNFLLNMTEIIIEMSNQKLSQIELNNAIIESEEKYRLLHEAAGVGIGYYSADGIVISYNKIAARNMGGKLEDFAGKSVFELFPKAAAETYMERIKKASVSETPQEYEDKVDLPNGVRWFNSVFTRITDSNKKITGIQIISTDISDRKLADKQRQNTYEQLNRIAANIPGAIYEYCLKPDGTSYIPYASEGFAKIYGLTNDEIKTDASPVFNLIHPDYIDKFAKSISDSAKNLTLWHIENKILLPSGEIKWVEGRSIPQKLEDGTILWQGYINDVTERKQLDNLLENSERRYRELFENMNTGFVLFEVVQDETGKPIDLIINAANKEFEKTTGLDLKQVTGKRLTIELPGIENDAANWIGTYGEIAINGGTKQFEDFSENLGYYYAVYAYQFSPTQCAVSFLDITERRKAEEEKQKFVMLAESSSEFIGMCDLDLKPLYVNPAGIKMVGLTDIEAACSVNVQDYFFPEDQQYIGEIFFPLVLKDGHGEIEIRLRNFKTGKAIWTSYYLFHLHNANGEPIGWATVSRDITDRVNAQAKIQESEANLKAYVNNTEDSIWSLDRDYNYTFFNKQYAEHFIRDHGFELTKGVNGKKQLSPEALNFWESIYEPVFTGEKKSFEFNHEIDGTMRYFQTSIHPIYEEELIIGASSRSIDITKIKNVEEDIKKINEELEQRVVERTNELSSSQAALLNLVEDLNEKTELLELSSKKLEAKNKELETFTYSVSHDLKAPLRGIDGYSSLLEELYSDKLKGEGLEFIKTIRQGTIQMNQLIEDLLAYSRFERTVLATSNFNIKNLIENLLNHQKNHISGKNVTVELLVDDCEIHADFNGVSIALRNLIENAFKFSSKVSSPQIKIVLKDNVSSWLLIVEDNGIGFDMKFKNKIYEIFHRLNLPEQYVGTGIGLALVAKSATRMGGKIWAESAPGKGAKFYFEIPKNTRI